MLMQEPVQLPKGKKILKQPSQPDLVHPLHQHLVLLLCHASGYYSKTMDFQAKLPNWLGNRGEIKSSRKQYNPDIKRWELYCNEGKIDPISAPIENDVN